LDAALAKVMKAMSDTSGEITENEDDKSNQTKVADDKQDQTEHKWDAFGDYYDNSGGDWYPDQDSATPYSVIEKQTINVAFENQYDPDGPPIDYYIPWIMRQNEYDSRPYYRPLPILDDAFYMYDWDFGEPFHIYENSELSTTSNNNQGNRVGVNSVKTTEETSVQKKSEASSSSDSDEEKPTSLVKRVHPDMTPAQPIKTLSHKRNKGWMQCPFCGKMFLESMVSCLLNRVAQDKCQVKPMGPGLVRIATLDPVPRTQRKFLMSYLL
jgi:hypothetical protein